MRANYPQSPGFKTRSPETSAQAAEAVSGRAELLRRRVLEELEKADLTADEVAERIGEDKLAVRPRVSELRRLGKVDKTSRRRLNASGQTACVWAAVRRFEHIQQEMVL